MTDTITVTTTCDECKGAGQREYEFISPRHFFDPYQYEERTCQKCGGQGEVEILVCSVCSKDENGCRCVVAEVAA